MKEKLNRYAFDITSLDGEDGIIDYIVTALGEKLIKSACEFGASGGRDSSNTYTLWHDKGWRAVLIEGDEIMFEELKENVKGYDAVAIKSFVQADGKDSIDDIFRKNGLSPELGILSIDIDSYDYHIWKNMTYLDPQVVIIEHNRHIPPSVDYCDPEGSVYLKCSVGALVRLGRSKGKGYRLVCCTRGNAIFIKDELFDSDKFPELTTDEIFEHKYLYRHVIFTSEDRNKYPVFLKGTNVLVKFYFRVYYRISTVFKSNKKYIAPPGAVLEQMKKMGLEA